MDLILKYFPGLTEEQISMFQEMGELYHTWNQQINVISRKDLDALYERHILHSLSIARLIQFPSKSQILDVGTGGGFPGIPLAVIFPEAEFTLVDSIGKKIKVVREVSQSIGLKNMKTFHTRAETVTGKYHFVISRAVTAMPRFYGWVRNLFEKESHGSLPNGIIALKGGDLSEELKPFQKQAVITPISQFFEEDFFKTKKIVYIPAE